MEHIILSHSGVKKLNQGMVELFYQDIETNLKRFVPGQWCLLKDERKNRFFLGFVNPFVENNRPCARIIMPWHKDQNIEEEALLESLLSKAVERRRVLLGELKNTRLIYGDADHLPGLIVDAYENLILIQVNTAGLDRHRENLKSFFESIGEFEVIFMDNKEYRKGEMLPEFESAELPETLEITENDLKYKIRRDVVQKIGFYFDHRLNRRRAAQLTSVFKPKSKCLDLFCYVGAWGLNLLSEGAARVDFIDQGDFELEITTNLQENDFEGRGDFHRGDVFKFLKEYDGEPYDVICSDPPAFCKSKKEANKAREGYLKLHGLCLKNLKPKGILIACSCTHYVGHDDFQETVVEAARREKRKIQLIDVGMQSYDHPIEALNKKNSYLKYYAYYVE